MSDYQKIKQVSSRIENLLQSVAKSNEKFSAIDKDMLSNYVRELYELIVAINPSHTEVKLPTAIVIEEQPIIEAPKEMNGNGAEKKIIIEEKKIETEIVITKDALPKKSISEIYAGKNENGRSVNEKFKKQGMEIADKLKQTPIKDLKSYIGLNKQFAFMTKLFNGDEQQYESAISKLNNCNSYEEASGYIQSNLLSAFNWSDEEPLVSEFFMLVMRRYLN
ncbi:MAG: hypothetical protein LH473_13535 [Chitinophagales bacterium]|nr:hypothetical protein [Chitinophagales bacterium]